VVYDEHNFIRHTNRKGRRTLTFPVWFPPRCQLVVGWGLMLSKNCPCDTVQEGNINGNLKRQGRHKSSLLSFFTPIMHTPLVAFTSLSSRQAPRTRSSGGSIELNLDPIPSRQQRFLSTILSLFAPCCNGKHDRCLT